MKKGYTLVEAMVAIAIISITVSIPVKIISDSILYSLLSEEKLTSALLTQEKIEQIRKIRDDNFYSEVTWTQDIFDAVLVEDLVVEGKTYKRTTTLSEEGSIKNALSPNYSSIISYLTIVVKTEPVKSGSTYTDFVPIEQSITLYPWLIEV